jgi:hypothetical protein
VWIDEDDAPAAQQLLEQGSRAAGVTASSLRRIVPSLEDVFIAKLRTSPS